MHDHHGPGGPFRLLIDGDEVGQRGSGDHTKAGRKAEGILETARNDSIGNANVHEVGQVATRRGLRSSKTEQLA